MFGGCKELKGHFEDLTEFVGVPLSPRKTEGPTTCLTFPMHAVGHCQPNDFNSNNQMPAGCRIDHLSFEC